MRRRLYQMRDSVACCMIGLVFVENNDSAAIRQFDQALQDDRSQLSRTPGDYDLVCLAVYDDGDGKMLDSDEYFPVIIRRGTQFVAEKVARESREAANASA